MFTSGLHKVDAQGLTVLHRAAREGDDALLDLLLRERFVKMGPDGLHMIESHNRGLCRVKR